MTQLCDELAQNCAVNSHKIQLSLAAKICGFHQNSTVVGPKLSNELPRSSSTDLTQTVRCKSLLCSDQSQYCYREVKKCTLVQALRICTGRAAHRGSRGIALLFLDHGTGRCVRGQRHTPAALCPWERLGTLCTGGCAGSGAGLDRCGKSRPHRDWIPGPSSP